MLTLSEAANRFDSARQQGAGFMARCPAHDDSKASLSISAGDDGKILLRCHAGCSFDDITKAASIKPAELFPDKAKGERRLVATYDYRDESGQLLYQSLRYEPKDFRQRDAKGNWTTAGIRRVLYRLPEIATADPEQTIFVVEGEKDADRLAANGVLATTNALGASKSNEKPKWLPEYSDSLIGRKIVLLPDNDDPGRAHMQAAAMMSHGKAASVRVLALPGLPEKGDVSDWLDAGGTIEELLELGDNAPLWKPADPMGPAEQYSCSNDGTEQPHTKAPATIVYQRITAAELDEGDYRTEFLIEGMLVAGQPLIIAGGKKCLKTNMLLDAAISLATATPMLGTLTVNQSCRVLVMSGESGLATIQETCRRICRAKGIELRDVPGLIFSPDLPRIGDIRHLDALEQLIVSERIKSLFVDPAYLCMDMDGREGSLFASGDQLNGLSKVCANNGVTLGLCHHTKKGLVDPFAPPELEHIAWAGFQEFARQWWLLGRRERFDPDSDGEHKLWLNVGGSAGFASLWAVDITEGKYPDPRRWEVTVSHASEAREQAIQQQQAAKADEKGRKHQANVEAAKGRIADALRGVDGNQDTHRNIRERAGMKGAAFDEAFAALLRAGKLITVEIQRDNGRKYEGYQYVF